MLHGPSRLTSSAAEREPGAFPAPARPQGRSQRELVIASLIRCPAAVKRALP